MRFIARGGPQTHRAPIAQASQHSQKASQALPDAGDPFRGAYSSSASAPRTPPPRRNLDEGEAASSPAPQGQPDSRSRSVVANHEALSRLRRGFKSRRDHLRSLRSLRWSRRTFGDRAACGRPCAFGAPRRSRRDPSFLPVLGGCFLAGLCSFSVRLAPSALAVGLWGPSFWGAEEGSCLFCVRRRRGGPGWCRVVGASAWDGPGRAAWGAGGARGKRRPGGFGNSPWASAWDDE